MANGNGLFQWITGGFAAALLLVVGMFQRSQTKCLDQTKDDVRSLEERTSNHGEAIAAIEANAASQHETLQRIDKKLDENWRRVDKKLDRLLHQ